MPKAKVKIKKETIKKKVVVKNKGGRPKAVINYKLLDELCGIQCTGEECSAILGINYDTLNDNLKKDLGLSFPDYFAQKSASGKRSLRRRQFQTAVGVQQNGEWLIPPNPTMQVWLGKNWLGQSDKQDINLNGKISYSDLSDEELERRLFDLQRTGKK